MTILPPKIDTTALLFLYNQGCYDKVCDIILNYVKHFNKTIYLNIGQDAQQLIDDFVSTFFFIITRPDFVIPDKYAPALINVSHLLVNIIAMSAYRNTDQIIQQLLKQPRNFVKLLITYSSANKPLINPAVFFNAQATLASLWWMNYQTGSPGSLDQQTHDCMAGQFKCAPVKFELRDIRTAPNYFQCSYVEGLGDRPIKEMFNRELQKLARKQRPIVNKPNCSSIAIVTDRWQPTSAVYKSMYPMVAALQEKYELTLVHFNTTKPTDTKLFKHVKQVSLNGATMDLRQIEHNDFQLAFFPDIGMNEESIYLSNIELAPIMVTGYGHPVSTFGSKIDYFIGGQEVEIPEFAAENYSERLVLIPGLGAAPVDPDYKRQNPKRDIFTINCCWTSSKINYPMLQMLQNILQKASRPVYLSFFPSWTVGRYNTAVPFQRAIEELFPGRAQVFLDKPYHEYLNLLEKGSLTIDSYPFGGYNTVVDSLFVGCPVVAIEGSRFFNRASSALLRRVGLADLSVGCREACERAVLSLIDNPGDLAAHTAKLASDSELRRLLVDTDEPKYFAKAIDYLIQNHETLQDSREPILIGT